MHRAASTFAASRWRLPALLAVPVGATALLLVGLLFGGGGDDAGGVDIEAVERAARGTGPSAASASGFPVEGDAATDEAPPVVRSLEELDEIAGEPPFANIGRMRIPAIGIDAPMSLRIVGDDGAMPNPVAPNEVSLYDLSAWDGLGGTPGQPGNAVLSGHVDQREWIDYAGVQYEGLAVFFHLDKLTPGQQIDIEVYGALHSYVVQWVREVPAASGEWSEILGAGDGRESITLITCGGDFNAVDGAYASRVVVRAEKAG